MAAERPGGYCRERRGKLQKPFSLVTAHWLGSGYPLIPAAHHRCYRAPSQNLA